jgi:hypothetical protein
MLLGQKIKDTLAFNQGVVAQNIFTFTFFQLLGQSSVYSHQSSSTKHAKQTHEQTKNNTPIKRKLLKERTKG